MNNTARSSAASEEWTDASKQRVSAPRALADAGGKQTSIRATLSVNLALRGPSVATNSLLLITCSLVST